MEKLNYAHTTLHKQHGYTRIMSIKLNLTLFTLLLMGQTFAESFTPLPVTPSEKKFVEYLQETAEITFRDTLPVEPWIQCEDTLQKRTFFSASLHQFTSAADINSKVQSWMASFLDYAYWGRVQNANCKYDINHFNECFASGSFTVHFRQKRIISFRNEGRSQYCHSD